MYATDRQTNVRLQTYIRKKASLNASALWEGDIIIIYMHNLLSLLGLVNTLSIYLAFESYENVPFVTHICG